MTISPDKPLLMVDIDGVISLFGVLAAAGPASRRRAPPAARGRFHSIDGIPHFLSSTAAAHLLALADDFDLVWASGWEEQAEEYLPHLLGLPAGLPSCASSARARARPTPTGSSTRSTPTRAAPAGLDRRRLQRGLPRWARARPAPTLLVQTEPEDGLTSGRRELLAAWARQRAEG